MNRQRLISRACVTAVFCCARLAAGSGKVTYQDDILPLVQANCAKCHNEDKKKADLDLTSYQGALKGSASGPVVVSGNLEASKLWKSLMHAEDPNMPPNQPRLPDDALERFKNWIQGGLLETSGSAVVAARSPQNDFALKTDSAGRPDGPPPMPKNLPRNVVVHTSRATAVTGLATSPWAPLIAVTGQKQILIFNTDSLSLLGILPFKEGQPVDVKFSRSGRLLIACGGVGAKSGRVIAWDIVTGKQLMDVGDDYDTVLAADIRPDQSQIALGGPSRIVKIWSTKTGELQNKLKKHTDWVTAVAFSPNGQLVATADRNGGISIWDSGSMQEIFSLAGHKSAITALSWRSDSKLLASSSEDGTAKLWEMNDGRPVITWVAHASGVLSVSYAHTDRLVTCGRDSVVTLWDGKGKKLRDCEKSCDLPLRASFTFDEKRIFASDFEGRVTAWNVADGKRIGSLDANPLPTTDKLAAIPNSPVKAN